MPTRPPGVSVSIALNCCGGMPSEYNITGMLPVARTNKLSKNGAMSFSKTCSCGYITKGEFPANVKANVQYGSRIEALTAYLNVRQYMPFGRIQEFYSRVMGLEISQ